MNVRTVSVDEFIYCETLLKQIIENDKFSTAMKDSILALYERESLDKVYPFLRNISDGVKFHDNVLAMVSLLAMFGYIEKQYEEIGKMLLSYDEEHVLNYARYYQVAEKAKEKSPENPAIFLLKNTVKRFATVFGKAEKKIGNSAQKVIDGKRSAFFGENNIQDRPIYKSSAKPDFNSLNEEDYCDDAEENEPMIVEEDVPEPVELQHQTSTQSGSPSRSPVLERQNTISLGSPTRDLASPGRRTSNVDSSARPLLNSPARSVSRTSNVSSHDRPLTSVLPSMPLLDDDGDDVSFTVRSTAQHIDEQSSAVREDPWNNSKHWQEKPPSFELSHSSSPGRYADLGDDLRFSDSEGEAKISDTYDSDDEDTDIF